MAYAVCFTIINNDSNNPLFIHIGSNQLSYDFVAQKRFGRRIHDCMVTRIESVVVDTGFRQGHGAHSLLFQLADLVLH